MTNIPLAITRAPLKSKVTANLHTTETLRSTSRISARHARKVYRNKADRIISVTIVVINDDHARSGLDYAGIKCGRLLATMTPSNPRLRIIASPFTSALELKVEILSAATFSRASVDKHSGDGINLQKVSSMASTSQRTIEDRKSTRSTKRLGQGDPTQPICSICDR